MNFNYAPSFEGKKVIEGIKNLLTRRRNVAGEPLFDDEYILSIDSILTDLQIELDKIKGRWSGIEILKLISDHLQRFDTSDALLLALYELAKHWSKSYNQWIGISDNHYEVIKQIAHEIAHVDRNVKYDREIVLKILRTIASITHNKDIYREIERLQRIWGEIRF
jgi:uncharacterized protein YukE